MKIAISHRFIPSRRKNVNQSNKTNTRHRNNETPRTKKKNILKTQAQQQDCQYQRKRNFQKKQSKNN